MFAGPNGSGKSTIKAVIRPELLGVYIKGQSGASENFGKNANSHLGVLGNQSKYDADRGGRPVG